MTIPADLTARFRGIYHAIASRGIPPHRNEGYKPFFIVGSGRAGTSLLRRFLVGEDVHIPPEMQGMGQLIRSFRQSRWLLSWREAVGYAAVGTVTNSECTADFKQDGLLRVVERGLNLPKQRHSLASLINCFYIEHANFTGAGVGKRWGDKTPLNSFSLPEINAVFPDARYIHLIRDGADVMKSYLKADLHPI
jgi:hypothetical protein